MQKYRLFGFLVLPALLTACSHQNPIVGTWNGTLQLGPMTMNVSDVFTEDGKNTMTMIPNSGPYTGKAIITSGTYTANNGTMTQTILTMSEGGLTKTFAVTANVPYSYTINGDMLTISGGSLVVPMTLTRQSS